MNELKIDLLPPDPPTWPFDPALIILPLAGLLSALLLYLFL